MKDEPEAGKSLHKKKGNLTNLRLHFLGYLRLNSNKVKPHHQHTSQQANEK